MNTVDALLPCFEITATVIRTLTVGGPLDDRDIRFCPKCKLAYKPDARIHKNPDTICPKCGNRLIKEKIHGQKI